MRSDRGKVYQIKMSLQCLPCFLWSTTQKHRSKIHLWVLLDEWPCTSPPLRSRVSVPAVAAVSAVKESCAWAALPKQNGAEGGGRDQQAPGKSGLPPSPWAAALVAGSQSSLCPTPGGRGGGLGSCNSPQPCVPQPREDQWMLHEFRNLHIVAAWCLNL